MNPVRSLAALIAVLALSIDANAQVSSVTGAVAPRLCKVAQVIAKTCSPELNGLRIVVDDGADATECGNASDVGGGAFENFCAWSVLASAWIPDEDAAHTIQSHSDTTATGPQLDTLTDGVSSDADALHTHDGKASLGANSFTGTQDFNFELIGGTFWSIQTGMARFTGLSAAASMTTPTLIGGVRAGNDLSFRTTNHASKGNYNFEEDASGTLRGCDADSERLQIAVGGNLSCEIHAPPSHAIAGHSDTTATGAELETLTDLSNADGLHVHASAGISGIVDGDVAGGAAIASSKLASDVLIEADIGVGLVLNGSAIDTKSDEAGFLEDLGAGDLTCGAGNAGKMGINDADALQYCDGEATPVRRVAAYGNDAGESLAVAPGSVGVGDFAAGAIVDADVGSGAAIAGSKLQDASTTNEGSVQLATQTEVNLGTDALKPVTPATLEGSEIKLEKLEIGSELDIGTTTGFVFGAADTTPDVTGSIYWKTNGDDTIFTDFDGAGLVEGDVIYIESASEAGYDCSSSFLVCGVIDMITSAGDVLQWVFDGTNWHMVGRNLMTIEHHMIVIELVDASDDLLIVKAEGFNTVSVLLDTLDCVGRGGSTANLSVTYSTCNARGSSCTQADATTLNVTANDTNFAKSDWDTDDDLLSGQWLEFTVVLVTTAPDRLNCDATIRRFYPL